MSKHNLAFQIQTALDNAFTPGMDKHAAKHNGESMGKICSFNEKRSLQEVSYQFKDFMKENYPQMKMIKDVQADHWQSFLNKKAQTCSTATLKNYVSRIHKIQILCQNKFRFEGNWKDGILVPQSKKTTAGEKLRIQAMDKDDLIRVLNYGYKNSTSKAIAAIDLCYRFALRDSEVAKLKVKDVNFEQGSLHTTGKGGRHRELAIKTNDVAVLKKLCQDKADQDNLVGIKADSINQQLNRILTKLELKSKYPLTSIHAIRKLKAQELWTQKREEGLTKKDTMNYVSQYLGHGKGRHDVINTYVQDQH